MLTAVIMKEEVNNYIFPKPLKGKLHITPVMYTVKYPNNIITLKPFRHGHKNLLFGNVPNIIHILYIGENTATYFPISNISQMLRFWILRIRHRIWALGMTSLMVMAEKHRYQSSRILLMARNCYAMNDRSRYSKSLNEKGIYHKPYGSTDIFDLFVYLTTCILT